MDDQAKAQLEALYGPCAKGDYGVGDQIRWPGGAGEVIWITGPGDTPVSGKHHPLTYVVDDGSGWPTLVYPSEITPE